MLKQVVRSDIYVMMWWVRCGDGKVERGWWVEVKEQAKSNLEISSVHISPLSKFASRSLYIYNIIQISNLMQTSFAVAFSDISVFTLPTIREKRQLRAPRQYDGRLGICAEARSRLLHTLLHVDTYHVLLVLTLLYIHLFHPEVATLGSPFCSGRGFAADVTC